MAEEQRMPAFLQRLLERKGVLPYEVTVKVLPTVSVSRPAAAASCTRSRPPPAPAWPAYHTVSAGSRTTAMSWPAALARSYLNVPGLVEEADLLTEGPVADQVVLSARH
jgi:hypothetical protein